MTTLPIFTTAIKELSMLQTTWSQILNTLLRNPSLQSNMLTQVLLVTGSNTINHGLGRNLQGWRVVRQRALASLYDTQDTNQRPGLTLTLVSSAPVIVDLEVF